MKTSSLKVLIAIAILSIIFSVVGPTPVRAGNVWAVGNLVGLCAGTPIHTGSGDTYPTHTIVPEDNWTVKVIDGPRVVNGETWWDTSRFAAGDPSGGTGWVKQSEADNCSGNGEGGGDDGSTGGGTGDPNQSKDGMLDTSDLKNTEPPYAHHFTWPLGYKPGDPEYITRYYGFGSPLQYKPCSTAIQNGVYYYLPGVEILPENRLLHPGKDFAVTGRTGGKDDIAYNDLPHVYAVAEGKVVSVQRSTTGYGNAIIIYHRYWSEEKGKAEYVWSLYAHLHPNSIRVTEGQLVYAGDWIGRYDHTGNWGDVAHAHFELRRFRNTTYCVTASNIDTYFYNPETFIPDHNTIPLSPEERAFQAAVNSLGQNAQLVYEQSATLQPGQTIGPIQFIINITNWIRGRWVTIFPGSTLEISIYRPDGSLYRTVRASNSFQLDLEESIPGTWSYTVKAIDLPGPNYPFSIAVGITNESLIDTHEVLDGFISENTTDSQPPTTTIQLQPIFPDGNNDWYKQPVVMTLSASDNSGGHVDILFSLNRGATFNLYTLPFTISTEGSNKISFFAVDAMGNSEEVQNRTVKVDSNAPVVDAIADQAIYTRIQPFVAHYSGYDPEPGSGLLSLTATFNSQSVSNGQVIDLFWLPLGEYTLSATGEDYAGWITTNSASIKLVATFESLQGSVKRLCQEKYIAATACTSLSQKLEAALAAHNRGQSQTAANILRAFQSEVKAQMGKSIKPEASNLLRLDSNYLLATIPSYKK